MNDRRQAIIDEIPHLRRYARALLHDRDAADDLVQDSLERALSRMENWTSGDSPRRWLFTIMHHLFVDQLRRIKRHGQAVTAMPEKIDRIAPPPPQLDRLATVDVLSALQKIGPERRAALVLVAVEGLSYADAANARRGRRRGVLARSGKRCCGPSAAAALRALDWQDQMSPKIRIVD